MHPEQNYRGIAERVFHDAGGSPVEVLIVAKRGFFTRFAEGEVHQNGQVDELHLFARLIVGDRTGRAAWNDLRDEGIRTALAQAKAIALARKRPDHPLPLLGPHRYEKICDSDPAFDRVSPLQVESHLLSLFRRLRSQKARASGYQSAILRSAYVQNSEGLEAFHSNTSFRFGLTLRRGAGIGYASDFSPFQKRLNFERVTEEALSLAKASEKEVALKPGTYTAILAPRALVEFLDPLFAESNARKVLDGESFFTGKKGKAIFSPLVHIEDNIHDPRQTGLPFDGEGVPRRRVTLVEKGEVKHFVGNRKAMREMGIPPTGHDAGGLQPAVTPNNIVMKAGELSLGQMIAGTKLALLISHIWYHRTVNRSSFLSTGIAKGNALLIRDGRLVGGVPNARYLEFVPDALRRVVALSREQKVVRDREWGASIYPYVQIEGFRFV